MRQTLKWVMRRASSTSRRKRSMAFGSAANSGRMVFSATRVRSVVSSASYTAPMPPRAMKRTMANRPATIAPTSRVEPSGCSPAVDGGRGVVGSSSSSGEAAAGRGLRPPGLSRSTAIFRGRLADAGGRPQVSVPRRTPNLLGWQCQTSSCPPVRLRPSAQKRPPQASITPPATGASCTVPGPMRARECSQGTARPTSVPAAAPTSTSEGKWAPA